MHGLFFAIIHCCQAMNEKEMLCVSMSDFVGRMKISMEKPGKNDSLPQPNTPTHTHRSTLQPRQHYILTENSLCADLTYNNETRILTIAIKLENRYLASFSSFSLEIDGKRKREIGREIAERETDGFIGN